MMNTQAPAFDDCGAIIDITIFTSTWFRENFGVALTTPLAAIFRCEGNRVKKVALPSIMDAAQLIAAHSPINFSIIGGGGEEAFTDALAELFAVAVRTPFPLPQENENATYLV